MSEIRVTPRDVQAVFDRLGPGDTAVLSAGAYRSPLRLVGREGQADAPIGVRAEPGAVLDGGRSAEDFRQQGNRMALATWQGQAPGTRRGSYPGLWPWLLDGHLVVQRCRHLRLDGLTIERGWPTLIALDRCRDLTISNCRLYDGTFAIGAAGRETYGITIEGCTWIQDREPGRLWSRIPWARVHGHPREHGQVDIEQDWRLFDGDFVRATGVAGGVTIRGCTVTAAFNAIHMFNPAKDRKLCRDVQVYDCQFREIRDNVLEPEDVASNWWFHHNEIVNCHKWFSIECHQSGYFYLFANRGWFNSLQGPEGDAHRGGGVFKFHKDAGTALGRHYVFHNSFSVRSDHMRKGILPRFEHFGNAIRFGRAGDPVHRGPAEIFGNLAAHPDHVDRRFTTQWRRFDIAMHHDVIDHPDWPERVRQSGYPVGPALGDDPRFESPFSGNLKLQPSSPCRGRGGAATLDLPDGSTWSVAAAADVGAWQGDRLLQGPSYRPLQRPLGDP